MTTPAAGPTSMARPGVHSGVDVARYTVLGEMPEEPAEECPLNTGPDDG